MAGKQTMIHNMTEGPLFRQIVLFSIPIIIGNLLQTCYTIADMSIVGKYIGAGGLAAVGIGGLIQNLFLSIAMGLGFGGQILLSQQVGAGEEKHLNKSVGTFMAITAAAAIVFAVVGLLVNEWLLNMLNTPTEIYRQAKAYNVVCYAGMLFIYGYNCIGSILRGLGQSKIPMLFIGIASAVNVALDIIFIHSFGMDVEGAALATVIAQGLSCIASIGYLIYRRNAFAFDFKPRSFIPEKKSTVAIMSLSMPIIIYGALMCISSMFINSNVNVYGVAAAAVDSIGAKLNMGANAVAMGIYTGSAAIVGQCFGAGKVERIKKSFWLTTMMSFFIWVCLTCALLLLTDKIFGFFTDDAEVLTMAPRYMRILVIWFLGISMATGPFALFEGVGNTTLEMIAGIVENLGMKLGLSMLCSSVMGLYGYWLGSALATFTTPAIGFLYFLRGRWITRKTVLAQDDIQLHR